jgi:hypothetical protein
MITRRQLIGGIGALVLGAISGCHNPTPEEVADTNAREAARQLKGETNPKLYNILTYQKTEVCYEVDNYPAVGDITKFWDAGITERGYGTGALAYVQIKHPKSHQTECIGRKDKRFQEFEKMFEKQVRPAAEKGFNYK